MRKPFYLGLIPARGGSKRIPRKNMIPFDGRPLISFTIEAALKSKKLSRVIVSTDDKKIAAYAKSLGAEVPFLRPAAIAQDHSPTIDAVLNAVAFIEKEGERVDAVVLLQPTSPFRTGALIDRCINRFELTKADTLTTVCDAKQHPYHTWQLKGNLRLTPFHPLRYQYLTKDKLPHAVIENGAVYVFKRSALQQKTLYGKEIVSFLMDQRESLDIDTYDDLQHGHDLLRHATPTF